MPSYQDLQHHRGQPIGLVQLCFFDSLVCGNTGTSDRRSLGWIESFWYLNSIICRYDTLFRHTAVNWVACIFYGTAKSFRVRLYSIHAYHSLKEPSYADTVANFGAFLHQNNFFDDTDTFVTERVLEFYQSHHGHVEVSVAEPQYSTSTRASPFFSGRRTFFK